MTKTHLILDLDNTIYPVHSIGDALFAPLFKTIEENGGYTGPLDMVKRDIMRKPFQVVAGDYRFSSTLYNKGIELLQNLEYNGAINAFDDFELVRRAPQVKFLVTTGFRKLQESKIRRLNLETVFEEIQIIDPMVTDKTKKDVFVDLIEKFRLQIPQLLVIGDDPNSEIKAAVDLGIDAVLYDKLDLYPNSNYPRITDYGELSGVL